MQHPNQIIKSPFGVSVFGSSVIRVNPDVASIKFSVKRIEKKPKDAFSKTKYASQQINNYLHTSELHEVGSSRVTLDQEFQYSSGNNKFIGYSAEIRFHLLVRDLNKVEDVLTGILAAGANNINKVTYQASELKNLRAEARKRAIDSAIEKAKLYASQVGVELDSVIHIEDVNPEVLNGRNEGHIHIEASQADDEEFGALNPEIISIYGAVALAYSIKE